MTQSTHPRRDTALSVFVSPANPDGLNGLSQREIFDGFLDDLQELDDCDVYIHTDPVHENWVRDRLPESDRFTLELGGPSGRAGLSRKVQDRLNEHFENGYETVIALAADTPGLGKRRVKTARRKLRTDESTAVVGPSSDGGFYLLGLNRPSRDLLQGVPFYVESTLRVLRGKLDVRYARVLTLETLRDVDQVADWLHVRREWLGGFRWLLSIIRRIYLGTSPPSLTHANFTNQDFTFLSRTHRSPPLAA